MSKIGIATLGLAVLAGCGGGGGGATSTSTANQPVTGFTLTSTAFSNGASIPTAYRCVNSGGAGNLPPLAWSNLPSGTKSLIVIMDDVDAAAVQGTTYTHYFAVIPYQAQVNLISSIDAVSNPALPYEKLTAAAGNNWVVLADLQPCNPQTTAHTYRWTAYALNAEYNSIATLKTQFDPIINNAFASSTTAENLNSYTINGNTIQANPRFTRSTFEADYGSYILGKATLSGTM